MQGNNLVIDFERIFQVLGTMWCGVIKPENNSLIFRL